MVTLSALQLDEYVAELSEPLVAEALELLALLRVDHQARLFDEVETVLRDREHAYPPIAGVLTALDQPPVDEALDQAGGVAGPQVQHLGHTADGERALPVDDQKHSELLECHVGVEQRRCLLGKPLDGHTRGQDVDLVQQAAALGCLRGFRQCISGILPRIGPVASDSTLDTNNQTMENSFAEVSFTDVSIGRKVREG